MSAAQAAVQIGELSGYLFESTLGKGMCFVPRYCFRDEAPGGGSFDFGQYVMSGWARNNGRFNPEVGGHRLFPEVSAIRHDLDAPDVAAFLHRLRDRFCGASEN